MSGWASERSGSAVLEVARRRRTWDFEANEIIIIYLLCQYAQKRGHGLREVEEDADVALGLGQRHCALQRGQARGAITSGLESKRLYSEDLDNPSGPVALDGGVQQPRAAGSRR